MREGNIDEGGEVVLENNYKFDIKYEDLVQYPGGGDIWGGGWVGGAGEKSDAGYDNK